MFPSHRTVHQVARADAGLIAASPPPPPSLAAVVAVGAIPGASAAASLGMVAEPTPSAATGCTPGPRFQHLQLNAPAQELWGCAGAHTGVRAVFLTFGSHSMADFLLNWVAHVRRLDQKLYLVGALDAKLAALWLEHNIPAATISDATLESMGAGKLGASATHTYYRYAPGTFLRMGLIKQVFIREMLLAGESVACCVFACLHAASQRMGDG